MVKKINLEKDRIKDKEYAACLKESSIRLNLEIRDSEVLLLSMCAFTIFFLEKLFSFTNSPNKNTKIMHGKFF